MTIDDGVALRRAVPEGDRVAALRRHRRAARRLDDRERRRHDHRRGVRRLGLDLLVQRRRPADSGRSASRCLRVSRARRCRGWSEFTASGSGTFDEPRNDYRFRVNDLFVGEEGGRPGHRHAGAARQRAERRDRRGVAAAGGDRHRPDRARRRRATPSSRFRFHDSSLDPYVRLFVPQPVAVHDRGRERRRSASRASSPTSISLLVDGTVDTLDMRLFDYAVRNAAPIRLALDQRPGQRRASCSSSATTRGCASRGTVGLHDERIALQASGDANLGILQGFFRDVRGSGRAELTAAVDGPLRQPVFSGSATITDGRIRHFSLPNALDAINGTMHFDARRHPARRRDGDDGRRPRAVRRPGRVRRLPARRARTSPSRGEDMQLRYPRGRALDGRRRSRARGNFKAPTLGGTVTVKSALWTRRHRRARQHLRFRARRSARRTSAVVGEAATTLPLRFDVQHPGAVDAAGREQPGAPGGQRRPDAARHLRSARRSSATPRSSAAR